MFINDINVKSVTTKHMDPGIYKTTLRTHMTRKIKIVENVVTEEKLRHIIKHISSKIK